MSAEELMELSGTSQLFDAAFHPTKNLLATALITGNIEVWKLPLDGDEEVDENESDVVMTLSHHRAACRGVKYLTDNSGSLLSISSDCSWALTDKSGQIVQHCYNAHDQAINKICLIEENMFATGDDAGVVKLWDMRVNNIGNINSKKLKNSAVLTWDAHTDFVSAMEFAPLSKTLFSTAGDATLCVYDIRHAKNFYKSDDQEAELTSLCVLEDRKLVACGTDNGTLLLFKWGLWGDCSDRFTNLCGQAESVNSLSLMRDGHTILAGCGDGNVHACSLYPMRRLGVVGSMMEENTVEGVVLNNSGPRLLMASFAYTERMVLWDMTEIENQLTTMATAPARDSEDESDDDDDDDNDSNEESIDEADQDDEQNVDIEPSNDDDDEDDDDEDDDDEDADDEKYSNECEGSEDDASDNDEEAVAQSNGASKKRCLETEIIQSLDCNTSNDRKSSDKKDKEETVRGKKKEKRLKTDSERFYADL